MSSKHYQSKTESNTLDKDMLNTKTIIPISKKVVKSKLMMPYGPSTMKQKNKSNGVKQAIRLKKSDSNKGIKILHTAYNSTIPRRPLSIGNTPNIDKSPNPTLQTLQNQKLKYLMMIYIIP